MTTNNKIAVLRQYLHHLKVPVTNKSILDELSKHPQQNTLLAISDILTFWNVPNVGYRLDFDELKLIPTSFIAHFKNDEFVLVKKISAEGITITKENDTDQIINNEVFKKLYSGAVLIAEKTANSGEIDYQKKLISQYFDYMRIPVLTIGLFFIFLEYLIFHSNYLKVIDVSIILITLFKTAGVTTCIFLLVYSIDANNQLIQRICKSNNTKDCNAILSSNAANLFVGLSWSEVGFFYFSGTWLIAIFNSDNNTLMQDLAFLNAVSLIYTLFILFIINGK